MILPGGEVGRFELGAGLARRFGEPRESQAVCNVLHEAVHPLADSELGRLEQLLEQHPQAAAVYRAGP